MSEVSKALKAAREAAALSQRQLAAAIGLSPSFINDVEHGRRELGEQHYDKLPPPIRAAVVKSAVAELRERIRTLLRLIK